MRNIALLLPLILVTLAADAQEHCVVGDTARQCATKIVKEVPPVSLPAAGPPVPTGIFDSNSPARSTLKDFLSVLNTHLDMSALRDDGNALTFAYNVPGSLLGATRQLQLETTFNTPKLMSQVSSHFATPEAANALERKLTNADDYSVALTFAPATRRFGREKYEPHQTLLDSIVIEGVIAGAAEGPLADPAAFEANIRAALPAVVEKVKADMGPRLANQSRIFFTGALHHRRDIVGPEERSGQVTLVLGSQNLSSFYANEGRDCAPSCAGAFARFVARTKSAIYAGSFDFDIKYSSTSRVTLPLYVTDVQPTHLVTYSVGYGRPFASLLNGKAGRLDLRLTFDGKHTRTELTRYQSRETPFVFLNGSSSEPDRDHRITAIAYTQQITDRLSIPVSVLRRDRVFTGLTESSTGGRFPQAFREHRTDVHFGILYRIGPATAPSPKSCCCS